jgi:pantoate--beta-alanine ligase
MGALHDGHRALIRRAHELADRVAVSIFVNPLQFAAGEDLARYPRPFEADLDVCEQERVDVVWAPDVTVVYPAGEPQVMVSSGRLGAVLEGVSRPGHFDGVLTVVTKLLGQVAPDVVVFGEKDAQQLILVRQMVLDLDLDVRVEGVPTVRDPDGLAISSRNVYLAPDERSSALALSRALTAGSAAAQAGPEAIRAAASAALGAERGLRPDYVALVVPATLADAGPADSGRLLLLVAGWVGTTRLIDNTWIECP